MEDWQKDFWIMLETVSGEVEHFFQEIGETVELVTDEISEAIETVAYEVQSNFGVEIDHYFQEIFAPFVEIYAEFDEIVFEDLLEDSEFAFNPKVEPPPNSACVGCQHYHGRIYGGNALICAMHPYGWDDEHCPDWEEKKDFYSDLFDI